MKTFSSLTVVLRTCMVVLILVAAVSMAQALTILHTGLINPATEGFSTYGNGWSPTTNALPGVDTKEFWQMTLPDHANPAGWLGQYYKDGLSASDFSGNWGMTAVVEVPTVATSTTSGGSIVGGFMSVYTDVNRYVLVLNSAGLQFETYDGVTVGWNTLKSFSPDPATYYTIQLQKSGGNVKAHLGGENLGPVTGFAGPYLQVDFDIASQINPAAAQTVNWNRFEFNSNGVIGVIAIPGDYNGDGAVNTADYVMWRKTDGNNPSGYNTWRSHFGESSSAGIGASGASSSQAAVPEPATLVLLMFAVAGWCLRRRPAA